MAQSFPDVMNDSRLMIAGLKQNGEQLSRRGLDAEFLSGYETLHDAVQTLDNEQERLKADLKSKSDELKQKLKELKGQYAEAKKIVKLDMPQTSWKEFGIQDSR